VDHLGLDRFRGVSGGLHLGIGCEVGVRFEAGVVRRACFGISGLDIGGLGVTDLGVTDLGVTDLGVGLALVWARNSRSTATARTMSATRQRDPKHDGIRPLWLERGAV
jgi:hypothetical protein